MNMEKMITNLAGPILMIILRTGFLFINLVFRKERNA